jgi:hypothetical protein
MDYIEDVTLWGYEIKYNGLKHVGCQGTSRSPLGHFRDQKWAHVKREEGWGSKNSTN